MPASRVKVVRPYSARGLYVFSAVFGSACGLGMSAEERWAFSVYQNQFLAKHLSPGQVGALAIVLTVGAGLLPAGVMGLWLSCLSQRKKQVAIAAGLVGAAQLLTALLADGVLWSMHGGADWGDWPLSGFLINLALLMLISAGFALLVRWLVRALLFTTIEQDGTRCPRCGYQPGSEAIRTCPECGTPVEVVRPAFARMHSVGDWIQRRAWVLAALLGVALVVQLGVTLHRRTLPALRFQGAFPHRENIGQGVMIPRESPDGSFESSCMAAWTALPNEDSRVIVILYVPDSRSPLPAMRLAVAAPPTPPSAPGLGPQVDFGSPLVGCDLARGLGERAIREGIPPELLKALAAEADKANWSPTVTRGGFGGVFSPTPQTHWVDPAPYFPGP